MRNYQHVNRIIASPYVGKVVVKVGFQLEDQVDQSTAESLLKMIAAQFTFDPAAVALRLVRCPSGDVAGDDRGVFPQLTTLCVDGKERTFTAIREIHGVSADSTGYQHFSNDGNFVYSRRGFKYGKTTAREASDSFPNASDGKRHTDNESIEGLRKVSGKPPAGVQVILLHRPAYNGLIGETRIERRRGINTLVYNKTPIGDPKDRGVITIPAHEFVLASRFLN